MADGLFIELLVTGKKSLKTLKEAVKKLKEGGKASDDYSKKQTNAEQKTNNLSKALQTNNKSLKGVITALKSTAFILAFLQIKRLTDALLENAQGWNNLQMRSNLSLQTLQKYGNVASAVNRKISALGGAGELANLEKRLYSMKLLGDEQFMWANAYGINPMNKTADEFIEALRDRLQGVDDIQASFMLEKIGISPELLPMLRLTRSEFEGINAELKRFRFTDTQYKQMQKASVQLQIVKQQLEYIKDRIVLATLPYVVKISQIFVDIVDTVREFAKANKPIIKFVTGLIAGLVVVKSLVTTIKIVGMGLVGIFRTLTGLFSLANIQIIGITALVAGLLLIIEDIVAYFQGRESFTGDLFGDSLKNAINDFINAIKALTEAIKSFLADKKDKAVNFYENKAKPVFEQMGSIYNAKNPIDYILKTYIPFSGAKDIWETSQTTSNNNTTNNIYLSTTATPNDLKRIFANAQVQMI